MEKGAGDWKRWFGENDIEVCKEFISDFIFCIYEGLNMATYTKSRIHCHTFAVTLPHQHPRVVRHPSADSHTVQMLIIWISFSGDFSCSTYR